METSFLDMSTSSLGLGDDSNLNSSIRYVEQVIISYHRPVNILALLVEDSAWHGVGTCMGSWGGNHLCHSADGPCLCIQRWDCHAKFVPGHLLP